MRSRLSLIAAAALAATACKKAEPPPPPAPTANVVTVHGTNYAFTAPDSIPAGLTTIQLVNDGPGLHHIQLMRLDSGRTFDSLAAALRHPGPLPRWITLVAGPNPGQPGDTTRLTTMLGAGHYAMLCLIPDSTMTPHFAHGMMRPLEVTASTGPAAPEPTADVVIHLTNYTFTESAPLTAGHHTIEVVNDADQPHEMFMVRLDSGTTAQQIAHYGETGLKGRQPPSHGMGGLSGLMPGAHTYFTVTLTPGTYGLLCFFPDMKDGKEHTRHGMVKTIQVN